MAGITPSESSASSKGGGIASFLRSKWLWAGTALAGGFYADQQYNGGRVSGTFADVVGSTDGYERAMDSAGSYLGTAWDVTAALGQGIAAATAHPAGNPWMMALAAVGAAVVMWKVAPSFVGRFISGSGFLSGAGRFVTNLALIGAVTIASAGVVGNLRDDPKVEPVKAPSAIKDTRLQQPAEPLERLPFGGPD